MRAIRGATCADSDTPGAIRECVKELLENIVKSNNLSSEDIACIMLSSTEDIRSFYPAKAAREAGFSGCALFSSLEPPIEGSLPLCIRALVLAEGEGKGVSVYLKGAKILRRDMSKKLVVALDGPASSGKSTAAKNLAKKLNILYLDTGAMYRAVALYCQRLGVSADDESAVSSISENIDLKIEYSEGRQITLLCGEDVSEEIRKPEISDMASRVSAYGSVRRKMVEMQRRIAASMPCVVDGRDIGTNVLPGCEYKFYVTASVEVRAKRRYLENEQKGYKVSLDDIESEIRERDKRDSERKIAPLCRARDAVVVDTSDMTPEQTVEYIMNKIQEKV